MHRVNFPKIQLKKKLFVDLWLCWVFVAVYSLSLVAESGGYSLVAVRGLLSVVAPLVAEQTL